MGFNSAFKGLISEKL